MKKSLSNIADIAFILFALSVNATCLAQGSLKLIATVDADGEVTQVKAIARRLLK